MAAVTKLVPLADSTGQAVVVYEGADWKPRQRENGEQMVDDSHLPLLVFKKAESAILGAFNDLTLSDTQTTELAHLPDDEDELAPPDPDTERLAPPKELLLKRWDPQTSWKPNVDNFPPHEAMERSPDGLMKQLQEIQQYRISRDRIISWAANLKLLTGGPASTTSTLQLDAAQSYFRCSCRWKDLPPLAGQSDPCSCRSITRPFDPASRCFSLVRVPRCPHYVAISYRWRKAVPDNKEVFIYDGDQQKTASAPPSVLLRAAAFAQHHGYQLLWCDQEGINQNDREDKEPGIQAMDLVYERAVVCLAPLEVEIDTQAQLDALAAATEPGPFPKWDKWIEWVEDMPWETLLATAKVARMIISDPWFGRSWILQESTAAYATMLLIKCSTKLNVVEHLGNLAGEIQLPLCALRLLICKLHKTFLDYLKKAAWYARQAAEIRNSRSSGLSFGGPSFRDMMNIGILTQSDILNERRDTCEEWGDFLGDFVMNTLPQYVHGGRYLCSALEASQRLANRKNGTVSDRLAILSNLCGFGVRLDSSKLTKLGYNLAACILCLSILNGDLSLVRMEDGLRYGSLGLDDWERVIVGISKGGAVDQSMVDFQIGPPGFSWAPRLIEGITESRLAKMPGFSRGLSQYHYRLSFHGNLLHIDGWLWKHLRRLEAPNLAKSFYRRRFTENEWASRYDKSDLPGLSCSLERCCKMTDPIMLKQCFWDLIQFFIEEGTPELAESLWVSLLISEMGNSADDKSPEESHDESPENSAALDVRKSQELRRKIHTIGFEEFSSQVMLQNADEHQSAAQFWIIQMIIHSGHLDIWEMTKGADEKHGNQEFSYAFFASPDDTAIFTPYWTPRRPLSWPKLLDLQQRSLSWPVKTEAVTSGSSQVAVSIHPTEITRGPIRGFWNVDDKPPARYVLR